MVLEVFRGFLKGFQSCERVQNFFRGFQRSSQRPLSEAHFLLPLIMLPLELSSNNLFKIITRMELLFQSI